MLSAAAARLLDTILEVLFSLSSFVIYCMYFKKAFHVFMLCISFLQLAQIKPVLCTTTSANTAAVLLMTWQVRPDSFLKNIYQMFA